MSRIRSLIFLELLTGLLTIFSSSGWGAEALTLTLLDYSRAREVEIRMLPMRRVGEALLKGEVRIEGRQAWIRLEHEKLKPAVYFGGDVACYIVWAVNSQAASQNLGELWVRSDRDRGDAEFSTGFQEFALLVTAESSPEADRPSGLVMFWNHPGTTPPLTGQEMFFEGFADPPQSTIESLAEISGTSIEFPELVQAERVLIRAEQFNAERYAPQAYHDAKTAYDQAVYMQQRRKKNELREFARASVASAVEAIQLSERRMEMERLEHEIRERQQRTEELEARADEAEELLRRISQERQAAMASLQEASRQLEQAGIQLESTRNERDHLQEQMAALRAERAGLQNRLQSALSQVADTRESARGFIVNLPDILFDVGKSTLKQDARLVIAKLAGILLLMPDLNLRIEGHTDSTGSTQSNLKLSEERAAGVFELLSSMGISPSRMATAGYGMDRPVADNSTAAGRQKNRRVEIIIAEGEIEGQ